MGRQERIPASTPACQPPCSLTRPEEAELNRLLSIHPRLLPWLRAAGALAAGYLGIWLLAPGLSSVLPLPPFEATAAAFLIVLVLFTPLVMLAYFGMSLLTQPPCRDKEVQP